MNWNWQDFHFVLKGLEPWLVVVMALLLGSAIWLLYRRETLPFRSAGKILRGLRLGSALLLILMLAQPVMQKAQTRLQRPVVALLFDRSLSMTPIDRQEPLDRQMPIAEALGLLPSELRDKRPEQAIALLQSLEPELETSLTIMRQIIQRLNENDPDSAAHIEKIRQIRRQTQYIQGRLNETLTLFQEPEERTQAFVLQLRQLDRTLQDFQARLGNVSLEKESAALLTQLLAQWNGIPADLQNTVSELHRFQAELDLTLGQSATAEVTDALERLQRLNRTQRALLYFRQALSGNPLTEKVSFRCYTFDTTVQELAQLDPDTPLQYGNQTGIGPALLRVLEVNGNEHLAAVVLCTDGRHTTGLSPEEALQTLRARDVELHILNTGSDLAPRDICVARLEGPLSAFIEETVTLTAHVKISGYEGQSLEIVLQRGNEIVRRQQIEITRDGWYLETFQLPAGEPGRQILTASIAARDDEALSNNNSTQTTMDVSNDPLRILMLDRYPRWESRYLASLALRDRRMHFQSVWLETQGLGGASPLERIPLTQEAWNSFDALVLGDLPPDVLPPERQQMIESYVSERGGFLIFLAGQQHLPHAYPTGPLARLLPIRMHGPVETDKPSALNVKPGGIRVQLNDQAHQREIVTLFSDPQLNRKLWSALPELQWVARPAYPKPGALALLETADARKDAVVCLHYYGLGRVLYAGSDEFWRWRYKLADRIHATFWSQALRWGIGHRLTGSGLLKCAADRTHIRPGEGIEIVARVTDERNVAISDAILTAELFDNINMQRIQLQPVPQSGGLYRGYLRNIAQGEHRVHVYGTDKDKYRHSFELIAREVTGQEGVELTGDNTRLAALAQAAGGTLASFQTADRVMKRLDYKGRTQIHEETFELWSSYPALLLVVGLLTAEWLLRKRLGLN